MQIFQDLLALGRTPHAPRSGERGYLQEGPSSKGAQPAISALKKQLQSNSHRNGRQTLGAKKACLLLPLCIAHTTRTLQTKHWVSSVVLHDSQRMLSGSSPLFGILLTAVCPDLACGCAETAGGCHSAGTQNQEEAVGSTKQTRRQRSAGRCSVVYVCSDF